MNHIKRIALPCALAILLCVAALAQQPNLRSPAENGKSKSAGATVTTLATIALSADDQKVLDREGIPPRLRRPTKEHGEPSTMTNCRTCAGTNPDYQPSRWTVDGAGYFIHHAYGNLDDIECGRWDEEKMTALEKTKGHGGFEPLRPQFLAGPPTAGLGPTSPL